MAQVDGANTFRGETVAQYAEGVNNRMLKDPASGLQTGPKKYTAVFQDRYMYNPTFESLFSIVPSVPALPAGINKQGQGLTFVVLEQQTPGQAMVVPKINIK